MDAVLEGTQRRKITPEMIEEAKRMDARGELTPENVWRRAQDPAHPMHSWFTWDAQEAAEAYWAIQARALIHTIQVRKVTSGEEERVVSVPVFVHNPDLAPGESGYIAVARMTPEQARRRLEQEIVAIRGLVDRTAALAGEWGLTQELRASLRQIVKSLF